ncbi:MAG: DUF1446 domain-containing protein [Oligoflexales bacterium]|nr:DUF1446 domain-containing protein [Oligoflexales bacterium]
MATRKGVLKIGNASGYWGDDPQALLRQTTHGDLDYITMDFLAEVTMSILQKQRKRDPKMGYAHDFVTMLRDTLPHLMRKGTKVITNAGGVNLEACAAAIRSLAKELGLNPKIAVVYGDDILPSIDRLVEQKCKFENMESGAAFSLVKDKLEAANVYFGAAPIVAALKLNPDIIISGRVTDTGITIAPMIHEFGWELNDWDKLASGIVAAHLMECGAQVTGGNFTDWHKVPSFNEIGYPIVEVNPDASFVITKHKELGGFVSVDTVREQLFYEMGDPKAYITPDVICDFSSIKLTEAGPNRVQVSSVKGYEPTPFYKVSMAYEDGFKCVGQIVISGDHARKKAEKFAEIFWARCGADFDMTETEYFGWNACHRSMGQHDDGNEIILRLGALSQDKNKLRRFGKLIPSLILSGPPGVAVLGGVPPIQEVVSYWPALMPKELVIPKVALFDEQLSSPIDVNDQIIGHFNFEKTHAQVAQQCTFSAEIARNELLADIHGDSVVVSLESLCLGRSGDKGDTANIGLIARSPEIYAFLNQKITAQYVKNIFFELCQGPVVRYSLENLLGYNFLLEQSLGGGGTHSLRTDPQGKTFSHALLRQKIRVPRSLIPKAH